MLLIHVLEVELVIANQMNDFDGFYMEVLQFHLKAASFGRKYVVGLVFFDELGDIVELLLRALFEHGGEDALVA